MANAAALPTTGIAGVIYVTIDNQLQYRWTGSLYSVYFQSKANLDSPTFINSLNLQANPLNTSLNRIKQVMALNDVWSIYGESSTSDQGIMVFEVGDNGAPFNPNGQKFEFRYINPLTPAENKTPLIIDYNLTTLNSSFTLTATTAKTNILKISDLASTGTQNLAVNSLGEVIANPVQIKSYVAILNQSALVAPAAAIIINSLSAVPTWAYENKTYIAAIVGDGTAAGDTTYKCFRSSNDVILLNTTFNAAYTNGQLNKASFKIEIYN